MPSGIEGKRDGDMTRAEHLAWCKRRALAYLPDNPAEAFASMSSDLDKHDETARHIGVEIGMQMMMSGLLQGPGQMREFIEGFN